MIKPAFTLSALVGASLALSACVSVGGSEPPDSLLSLTPTAMAPAGSGASHNRAGNETSAIAVLTPEVPAKIDVQRVPVNVSDTEIAYLQEAVWVEKPARLFRRLLGETLRTRGSMLVLDGEDSPTVATRYLRGSLIEMGYDAPTSSVVVSFNAVLTSDDGTVTSRRFEAREEGVLAEVSAVGPALNRASNTLAGEVADWVISKP
ncbi:ABC transporter [Erythrobacter sp. KY5]|uniref:ABC-type transport auxiliary lipoprotein family protein n=1 Tax=Erythrobacter sp. KY5 TaxID=2011159 RepID=UPI000DBF3143|nr:ABC-type transport auxiliary lipoprotein family protein [Erythrobacter sp. KY5]AWW73904.1 ABC transporter [Erythrobacter sp. KY5]